MPNLTFDFTWYRDSKGYRLVPAKPIKRKPGQSQFDAILESPASLEPSRVVRKGGKLESYRPLDNPDLWRRFITIPRTDTGVLQFIEEWGPLTGAGLRTTDAVIPRGKDRKPTVRGHGEQVWWVIDSAEEMKLVSIGRTIALPLNKLVVTLVRENGELRLKVRPVCLLDALWLQFAQANPHAAKFKRCQQCDTPFAAGAGFGRRKDAEFCSDECRIKFNSLKRSR